MGCSYDVLVCGVFGVLCWWVVLLLIVEGLLVGVVGLLVG